MSNQHQGRRARRSALALLTAGAVVAGVLSGVPAATAAKGDNTLKAVKVDKPVMKPGRYVVLLKAPAAASYAGGDAGLAATRVAPGQQFDGDRTAVKAYTSHLRAQQQRLARSVGATIAEQYTTAANGFAAKLTGKQASLLSADKDVLLVAKDEARHVDTWNTPSFLGLSGPDGAWNKNAGSRRQAGQGTVVGVIDSGIWPESKSFHGADLTRKPQGKWNVRRVNENVTMDKADGGQFTGACEIEHDGIYAEEWSYSDCNAKLVGARFYPDTYLSLGVPQPESEFISTRDGDGHGSHTASTTAGAPVSNATVEDVNFGEVSGMAPGARIAAYKVCFDDGDEDTGDCYNSAILAAIDDAINDGVDTINFSISGATDTVIDAVEIAFEGAAEAGIFVAASAGNSGPDASTVAHNSPWLTTVAASTHHNFENTVVLGDGTKIKGASISKTAVPSTPLVVSSDVAAAGADPDEAALCFPDTLDPALVDGKMVVCNRGVNDRVEKSATVADAGGVAMILANITPGSLDADFHSVPTVHIQDTDSPTVFDYVEAEGDAATAAIQLGDTTGGSPTPLPQIAGFSSRGPALANDGDLLKPDISAPGVSVLAAVAPPSGEGRKFDLYSGTSMASPHIAGLANFIMGVHPSWSPMKVKSAMMTTARSLRTASGGHTKDAFAQGAGQVTPKRMFDPGLFVTSTATDWRRFIQGQGLDIGYEPLAAKALNGPSLAEGEVVNKTTFRRTFTAGVAGTWKPSASLAGFDVDFNRSSVRFAKGQSKTLKMTFTRTTAPLNSYTKGFVVLSGPSKVRLPVALKPVEVSAPAEVAGSVVDGDVDVPLTAGFTGDLDIVPNGLAEAQTAEDTVNQGEDAFYCMEVAADSKVARFELDSADDDADLDMYVYPTADPTCAGGFTEELVAATGAADEQLTLENPEAGFYLVDVYGYAAAPNQTSTDFRLDVFDVTAGAGEGTLTATPDPLPVTAGEPTEYNASWSGLSADTRYLGVFEYGTSPTRTYLTVDTRPVP